MEETKTSSLEEQVILNDQTRFSLAVSEGNVEEVKAMLLNKNISPHMLKIEKRIRKLEEMKVVAQNELSQATRAMEDCRTTLATINASLQMFKAMEPDQVKDVVSSKGRTLEQAFAEKEEVEAQDDLFEEKQQ
jgi:hypothetical protein